MLAGSGLGSTAMMEKLQFWSHLQKLLKEQGATGSISKWMVKEGSFLSAWSELTQMLDWYLGLNVPGPVSLLLEEQTDEELLRALQVVEGRWKPWRTLDATTKNAVVAHQILESESGGGEGLLLVRQTIKETREIRSKNIAAPDVWKSWEHVPTMYVSLEGTQEQCLVKLSHPDYGKMSSYYGKHGAGKLATLMWNFKAMDRGC